MVPLSLLRATSLCGLMMSTLAVSPSFAQQGALHRYDVYAGFSDLNTPGMNKLNQVGLHLQAGLHFSSLPALGIDYSVEKGSSLLTSALATASLQRQLAAELPSNYHLKLPFDGTTQSITGGTQLAFRRYRNITFFVRPVLAASHINVVPHPKDPVATLVSAQFAPHQHMSSWFCAYGAGGGAEFHISDWLGTRVQFDAAWNHPFTNLLEHGGVSYRYTVGPAFHFGHRVQSKNR